MITIICGIPGSGKTTYAAALAVRESKRRTVFTNFAVNPSLALPPVNRKVYRVDGRSFFERDYPEGSLLILDEAALDFDARRWDSFPAAAVEFVKLHRHMKIDLVFVTQALCDIDKKVRSCAEQYIYVVRGLFGFSRILKYSFVRPVSDETSLFKGGVIKEDELTISVKEPSFLGELFSKRIFRPLYYKSFDSYALRSTRPMCRSEKW